MKVQRYDYPNQLGENFRQLMDDIEQMLLGGQYVLSKQVMDFEHAFADYLGAAHVCGVNSGTDALMLALNALDIGQGDEVVTQANTFHATVSAICKVGATPVLVDADPATYLMDVDQLQTVIGIKTRAIIPVHLFGKATEMRSILTTAANHNIEVIEDAAQAHGAEIDNHRVGTIGRIGCFSFHPSKNLAAAGDAGAICTNDAAIAERIRELRGLGQRGQNHHVRVGWNSKLDAIQARILSEKLPRLDAWNDSRRRLAKRYRDQLGDLELGFQEPGNEGEHVYHLFQVRTPHRDELLSHLQSAEIDAVQRYPTPIHLQPAFESFDWQSGEFPVAERLANELLCLPIRPNMNDDEVDYTAAQVRTFFGRS